MTGSKVISRGLSFEAVLIIVFITLKLTDNIDWSWWWVLSPIWISLIIAALVFIIGIVAFVWKDAK